MNIYQKLLSITAELSTVSKNLEVGTGQTKYKAVGELDVLKAVRPLEVKHGIYSYPTSRRIIESGIIENKAYDKNGNEIIRKNLYERIEVTYRFVNVDNPEEFIEITSYGDGIDSQDKSVGKAMTYADKYALMKAYKIMTGDDPDQNESAELKEFKPKELNPALLEQAADLKIDLNKLAAYKKKPVNLLTDEDLTKAIEQKRAALANKKSEEN